MVRTDTNNLLNRFNRRDTWENVRKLSESASESCLVLVIGPGSLKCQPSSLSYLSRGRGGARAPPLGVKEEKTADTSD